RAERDSINCAAPNPGQRRNPLLENDTARRKQHRVHRRQIIATSFSNQEEREGNYVQPAKQAIPFPVACREEEVKSGEPKLSCEEAGADPELIADEMVGAALAHVAGVNVLQEVK